MTPNQPEKVKIVQYAQIKCELCVFKKDKLYKTPKKFVKYAQIKLMQKLLFHPTTIVSQAEGTFLSWENKGVKRS